MPNIHSQLPMILLFIWSLPIWAQPKLLWPLGHEIHDKTYISNYADNQASSNNFTDYNCGRSHGYDGHLGTDMAVNSFRDSDQGVAVLAAAGGVVTLVRNDQFDRNYWPPYEGSGNGLWVLHDDGDYAIYWHMREESVAVKVGERVSAGQFLGYVASSGLTPIPHLHFQMNNSSNLVDAKDPFTGACNQNPGMWTEQIPYVGDAPLRILDHGISVSNLYNGVFQNGELKALKDRLPEPLVFGKNEVFLTPWVQFQGNVGDQITFELIDADGATWYQNTQVIDNKRRYGWYAQRILLANQADMAEGLWQLKVSSGGQNLVEHSFAVGNVSVYSPRFYPISGKSFQLNGSTRNYTLQEMGLAGAVDYRLIGAPTGFSLQGNQLTVPGTTDQPYRNHNFSIAVFNAAGNKDYFQVHVVDPAKPFNSYQIDNKINGNWYNPVTSGSGFSIEAATSNNYMFLTWYTFDEPTVGQLAKIGNSEQRWLVADGFYLDDVAELGMGSVTGGIFDNTTAVNFPQAGSYGSIKIKFEDCNRALISYDMPINNRSGIIPVVKLFPVECQP